MEGGSQILFFELVFAYLISICFFLKFALKYNRLGFLTAFIHVDSQHHIFIQICKYLKSVNSERIELVLR